MDDGILYTIKRMLGVAEDYTVFDVDIIVDINAAFMVLQQAGVGPSGGFMITGDSEAWSDFIPDEGKMEALKQFVYLRTKMIFDPPTSSSVENSMNNVANELLWRLNVQAEGSCG